MTLTFDTHSTSKFEGHWPISSGEDFLKFLPYMVM